MTKFPFFIRIELHGRHADYRELHAWMAKQGFSTTVTAGDGSVYQLPTAMYRIESSRTKESLRDWLVQNMPTCGSVPNPWILVVKSDGAAWHMGNALRRAA